MKFYCYFLQVILKELVTKWKESRQEGTSQKNRAITDDIDHTSVLVEVVPDIEFNSREITDSLRTNCPKKEQKKR